MRNESIHFWENDPSVRLDTFTPEGENLPVAVILPGGAYFAISDTESDSVAEKFAEMGFAAFVLRYSTMHPGFDQPDSPVNPHTVFPEPIHVVAAAIKLIRSEFDIDRDKVSLVGFSAGGHLAANYCNEWVQAAADMGVDRELVRPNADVLCYAATQLRPGPATMNMAVFGPRDSYPAELLRRWCAQENVSRDTPPTFLWHTVTDNMVPVAQTYRMAEALNEEGIAHECHIFDRGPHAVGLSLGYPGEIWPELARDFILRNT